MFGLLWYVLLGQIVVWKVRVIVLKWEEEVVWSVFVGVPFGSVFESVFVEVKEVLVSSEFMFGAEVVVEVVGSVWKVQMLVQKKQQRVSSSCTWRERQAS